MNFEFDYENDIGQIKTQFKKICKHYYENFSPVNLIPYRLVLEKILNDEVPSYEDYDTILNDRKTKVLLDNIDNNFLYKPGDSVTLSALGKINFSLKEVFPCNFAIVGEQLEPKKLFTKNSKRYSLIPAGRSDLIILEERYLKLSINLF